MAQHTRTKRRDENQAEIVQYLQALGVLVVDTSQLGGGFPDLICGHRGRWQPIEVKNPGGGGMTLTDDERAFHLICQAMGLQLPIVTSGSEAAAALGIKIIGGAT